MKPKPMKPMKPAKMWAVVLRNRKIELVDDSRKFARMHCDPALGDTIRRVLVTEIVKKGRK